MSGVSKPGIHVVHMSILGRIQIDVGTIMWNMGVIIEQNFALRNDNHQSHGCHHTYLMQHLLCLKLLVSLQQSKQTLNFR